MGGTKLPVLVEAPVLDSLMVENVDYTSTTLTARWNEVENAVSYNLHISSQAVKEDSEEPSSQTSITVESTITGITDTSYTVEDLPNGATVTYKVQAVDENGGESEWSKAVTIVLPRESDAIPSLYSNPSQQKQLFFPLTIMLKILTMKRNIIYFQRKRQSITKKVKFQKLIIN